MDQILWKMNNYLGKFFTRKQLSNSNFIANGSNCSHWFIASDHMEIVTSNNGILIFFFLKKSFSRTTLTPFFPPSRLNTQTTLTPSLLSYTTNTHPWLPLPSPSSASPSFSSSSRLPHLPLPHPPLDLHSNLSPLQPPSSPWPSFLFAPPSSRCPSTRI